MKNRANLMHLLLFFVIPNLANAQFWQNNSFYIGFGSQIGNFETNAFITPEETNYNYTYKQKYTIQYRRSKIEKIAQNIPNDYKNGLCFTRICEPTDKINTREILLGKIKRLHKHLRVNIKAGISFNYFTTLTSFTKHSTGSGWLSSYNYKYNKKEEMNIGLVVNPSIELPVFRTFGFSLAPYVNINSKKVVYGGQFEVIFGLLRPKAKKNLINL